MAINVKDKLVTLESLGVAYSAEQDAREEADQALSTRIDNIVAPDGDPSLTEVSDARVSGSTTHNTLKARLDADKTAIETEISQLSADLANLEPGLSKEAKEALLDCFDHVMFYGDTGVDYFSTLEAALFPDGRYHVLKLSDVASSKGINGWIKNKYLRLSDPPVTELGNSSTPMTYTTVRCSAGDKFKINAVGAVGGRAWGFLNSNNEVISMADENVTVTDLIITAPANAVKLVIHNKNDGVSHGTCYKVEMEEITDGWVQGYYYRLSNDPMPYHNGIMTYVLVNCSAGDKFLINTVGAVGGRAWGFLNSNNEVISMAEENATVTNLELTAPANAVKLAINSKGDGVSYGACYKVEQEEITGFVVNESGNIKYSAVAKYSVIEFDASITNVKFFENTALSTPGAKPWFIFRKVDSDTFYGTDGTDLFVFTWDASSGKYNATKDNSIASISTTNLSSFVLPQNRELTIKNGVATLKNDNGGIISISNANIVSIWDQDANYTYESVRVK